MPSINTLVGGTTFATAAPASGGGVVQDGTHGGAVVIDGTPLRVVIIGASAAAVVVALRWAGIKFNVGVSA